MSSANPSVSLSGIHVPNEILLQIGMCLSRGTPKDAIQRQQALSSLSRTCHHLRNIAVECLLAHPIVHQRKVPSFLRLVLSYPQLAEKTEIMEFKRGYYWKHDRNCYVRHRPPEYRHDTAPEIFAAARRFVLDYDNISVDKSIWLDSIKKGIHQAYIALILAHAPKLKDLRLGDSEICCHACMGDLFLQTPSHPSRLQYEDNCTTYLKPIFTSLVPRLQVLDLPIHWNDIVERGMESHCPSTSAFTSLQYLSLSSWSIFPKVRPFETLRRLLSSSLKGFLRRLLPSSLKGLILLDFEFAEIGGDLTIDFLWLLLDSIEHCPTLRRIQIYLLQPPSYSGNTWSIRLDALAKRMAQIGITLDVHSNSQHSPARTNTLFFARDANYQPWRYTDQELRELEREVHERRLRELGFVEGGT